MQQGTVLGGRYRVLDKVGGGGMAVVYRAQDLFLNRPVAVKVLQPQYAADEEFVRRFRREAQAAASLSHPNVVSVYDVGHQDDLHYIVMELVEGETLKHRIQTHGPLPPDEAARITVGILDALAHAHGHRIVHRDIKPHNILLTRDGRVKVTDFGIARAVSHDTVTNTGSLLGSAHYFSPEMARGWPADEKSDLYSLGVVLYEMLTGRVPFTGESPVSVALKHVQEEVRPPSALVPGIPAELETIVLRAMEKDPKDRYASAQAMRADLERFLAAYREGRVHFSADDAPTQDLRAVRARAARRLPPPDVDADDEEEPGRRRSPAGLWIALGLVALFLAALGTGAFYVMRLLDVPDVQVPYVVGMSRQEAEERLAAAGLVLKVDALEYSDSIPPDGVTWQEYEAGSKVKPGRVVAVRLSMGPRLVPVPDLSRMTRPEAEAALAEKGLQLGNVTEVFDPKVPEGRVISQSLSPGVPVRLKTVVDIVVSRGGQQVPNLAGKTLAEAEALLKDQGLALGQVGRQPSDQPEDLIISQDPQPGAEVAPGSAVNVTLSSGPPQPAIREATKLIEVPGKEGAVDVRVDLVDAAGVTTVHHARHPAGEIFQLAVRWTGESARLLVYADGKPAREIPLP
ncbi:Stk1 family PASTA domain-containing Ser/Thr kinase [Caldinitratiruptor microaerophilus]|uniref:Stk1 family PASTA domain-containing Ser/Thr kinase n=1 Tax=Caldinitratiruptor microaerophilus TaxID=671077 RepID=UPI0022319F58|nr:Stk1 family PASTA domain-containing Ser/Thr kinase [Caldinitratiruptor microaerophilus]